MKAIAVIATYNEADTIEQILEAIYYPVIVVDDSSPDGTGRLAAAKRNVHVMTRPERLGIATAYMKAFEVALSYRPRYIIQMDAGLTHSPEDIDWLVIYDKTTDCCYYIPANTFNGRVVITLRLKPTKNTVGILLSITS